MKRIKKAANGMGPGPRQMSDTLVDHYGKKFARGTKGYNELKQSRLDQTKNLQKYVEPAWKRLADEEAAAKKKKMTTPPPSAPKKKMKTGGKLTTAKGGKQMMKRADGSTSPRGLWDNIRSAAKRNKAAGKAGKKPTAAMLKQERKIKAKGK